VHDGSKPLKNGHTLLSGEPLHVEDAEVASWSEERLQEELFKCLKEKNLVNPQILGRIGKTNLVIFHHFTKNEIASIRDSEIEKLKQMVAQTFKSKLDVDATTLDWLMTTAWGDTGKNAFNVGARVITDLVKAEVEGTINQFLAKERKNDIREKSWNMTMAEESGVLKPTLKIAPLGDKK
jgi:ATP-dependent Clp protease ATP-binding subunit ClpA